MIRFSNKTTLSVNPLDGFLEMIKNIFTDEPSNLYEGVNWMVQFSYKTTLSVNLLDGFLEMIKNEMSKVISMRGSKLNGMIFL